MTSEEQERMTPTMVRLPSNTLLRFVRLAVLNHRVGSRWGPAIRVAWKDTHR